MVILRVFFISVSVVASAGAAVSLILGSAGASDKYEVFRDLLLVLLALVSVGGLAIYHLVREAVKTEVMDSVRKEISRERGKNLISIGVDYFGYKDLTRAIARTKEALRESGLDEANVIMAKNNLAYYLACKYRDTNIEQDAAEAIAVAEEVYKRYDTTNELYNFPEWVETWAFVRTYTVKANKAEIRELLERFQSFLARKDLESKWNLITQHIETLRRKLSAPT